MKLITLHLKLKFSTPKKNVNTPQNICEYQSLVAYNNSTVAALEIFLQIETTLKRILQINYANRKHKSNSYIDGFLYFNMITTHQKKKATYRFNISSFLLASGNSVYIPDEDVRFIRWAPNFGAAGLAPRPLPADKGLALVVGAGAAMAAQGSSSSVADDFKFKGFDVFGAGAAMEPHKSSSSLPNFGVLLGRKLEATNKNSKPFNNWYPSTYN